MMRGVRREIGTTDNDGHTIGMYRCLVLVINVEKKTSYDDI